MVYTPATVAAVSSNEAFVVSEDILVKQWSTRGTVQLINYIETSVELAG